MVRTITAGKWTCWILMLAVVCGLSIAAWTTNSYAASAKKVELYATDGYHTLPDGKQIYFWGFSLTNQPGSAVFPGPKLEAVEGEPLEIKLTNIGPKKTDAQFQVHALRVDEIDAVGNEAPVLAIGQSDTRQITVQQAGTYFYYSSNQQQYGIQMGLNGPLVVKAKGDAKLAWTGGPAYDQEYVFHINELDPTWHAVAEQGNSFDSQQFHPRYWTINGKAFPDLESDPTSMVHGKVGEVILVRLINPGLDEHPMHLHGHHFRVIAENGKPLSVPVDKDTVPLEPGETKDILIVFDQSGNYPFHSHKITDNTNNGVYPGGLHTMTHIEDAASTGSTMVLEVGSTHAMVNGQHVMLDSAPFQLNGDTYIPLQFAAEQLGGQLQSQPTSRSYSYKTEHTELQLWQVQRQALLNGKQIGLKSPVIQKKGKPMIAVSTLASALCAKVADNQNTGVVTLEYAAGQECSSSGPDRTAPVVSANPLGGSYTTGQSVTLTIQDDDPLAKIYYTLDGTIPTSASAVYHGPIPIATTTTLKFIGIDTAGNKSEVKSEVYTIQPAPEVFVDVLDAVFSSPEIKIKKGTKVTWILKSNMLHTVTSFNGLFDAKLTPTGDTQFSYTFNEVGEFGYLCLVHASSMTGTVIVE